MSGIDFEGFVHDYPPWCVHCDQVLTIWNGSWVLWGWAGRGITAQRARICPAAGSPDHLHAAAVPSDALADAVSQLIASKSPVLPSRPGAEVLAAELARRSMDAVAQPHCKWCQFALEWKHEGWWAENSSNGHLFCPASPDPANSKHIPVAAAPGTSCNYSGPCDCPFHDKPENRRESLRGRPYRKLKSGAKFYPRGYRTEFGYPEPPRYDKTVHTDPPAKDPPKATRPPMDELYAGTTGRKLPEDSYDGWGREWVDTGIPYAKERMVGHASLTVPVEGFKWDAPVLLPVEPPKTAAELTSDRKREAARDGRIWLLAMALVAIGWATGIGVVSYIGSFLWFLLFLSQLNNLRTTRNKIKAVEGRHAKPKSG